MSNLTNLNGEEVSSEKVSKLVIEYNHITGQMKVGGEMASLDLTLNVLAQATRYFEARYRHQQTLIFNAETQRDLAIQKRVGGLIS